MMLLSSPLRWSSMFTIRGTSKDSVIAFYESLTPLKGVLPSRLLWTQLLPLSDSLIAINGVFKGKYSFLFYVDFPSVLTNFR